MANRLKLTPKKKKEFVEQLKKTANVSLAANACNVKKQTLYNHKKSDSQFSEAWDEAVEEAIDMLEAEAQRRAFMGCDEPVYQGGKNVGVITKYSDVLAMFLLKAYRPEKFRERFDMTSGGKRLKNQSVIVLPQKEEGTDE